MSAEKEMLQYERADLLITLFTSEDIVTTSNPSGGNSGSSGGSLGGDGAPNDGGWTER